MSKKILRLKLNDFINSDIEDNVISFLKMIKSNAANFIVHLWYDKNIKQSDLDKFKERYGNDIKEIEMYFYIINSHEIPAWYDIISEPDVNLLSHYKFRFICKNKNDIIKSLLEFNNLIKFEYSKNIGYKNAKNSDNWLNRLGRQN